ncbi:hypothetical protein R3P38DRAFT_3177701 [Favolaschia claudopus]|uniref:Uncharacterized protein n=1 Tax=Favolaschia claudopus TaxID=2862362 RepID=A0AAW0CU51_9AGAR
MSQLVTLHHSNPPLAHASAAAATAAASGAVVALVGIFRSFIRQLIYLQYPWLPLQGSTKNHQLHRYSAARPFFLYGTGFSLLRLFYPGPPAHFRAWDYAYMKLGRQFAFIGSPIGLPFPLGSFPLLWHPSFQVEPSKPGCRLDPLGCVPPLLPPRLDMFINYMRRSRCLAQPRRFEVPDNSSE